MFAVDPAFAAGAEPLASLALCEVWLQRDARYPWLILIPRVAGAVELEDLSQEHRVRLIEEIVVAGEAVRAMAATLGRPVAKLNVGAIGNITRQCHVHVVGRRTDDDSWPDPVWGRGMSIPYAPTALEMVRASARDRLGPQGAAVPGRGMAS